ncbi:MAG: prepilin peptidase [Methanomicrobiales archaeon]|nr:prepilin peptidase [Methanomicrobiales archaeon]
MILPLLIGALAIGITLLYASVLDLRDRRVPVRTWYPMLIVAVPMVLLTYAGLFSRDWKVALTYLLLSLLFSAVFYLFAYFRLFGGADAYALIFISCCVPLFPYRPLWGYPPLGFLPFSVLVNAVILNLVTPLGIALHNLRKGNRAPLPYPFFGFPVPGDGIQRTFGFVMEEFEETPEGLRRQFIPIGTALSRMMKGEGRIYTRDLREHPEQYAKELALYRRAGQVWISYGVPFIVPIAAGFFTALIFGDILYEVLSLFAGA